MNSTASALLFASIAQFLNIYLILLIVRCLLTWFQNVSAFNQLASFLSPITDPYLNLFRSIIPPLGGMDFSPMLAILVLQIVAGVFSGIPSGGF